jgi:hypothetical protein
LKEDVFGAALLFIAGVDLGSFSDVSRSFAGQMRDEIRLLKLAELP